MIKLYDIPKESKIIIDGEKITFKRLDGMYSYCESNKGIVHLKAYTPLVKVGDHYEIDDRDII